MKEMKIGRVFGYGAGILFLFASVCVAPVYAQPPKENIDNTTRCPVCGMFVSKFPSWVTGIVDSKGDTKVFDGAKDMLAYYFDPGAFGADSKDTAEEIWVKDYYTLTWIDGRKAYYVLGSDVLGPMGEELIPLQDKSSAEKFRKDHHGKEVLSFSEITKEKVDSLRSHHMMH